MTSLPTVGLSNHSSLEVILLQGNRIRNLPVDLGTIYTIFKGSVKRKAFELIYNNFITANVPSLKGLQTSGNPLTNVPYDCIAEGFSGVINHLKKLSSQNNILVPSSSQTVVVKPSTSRGKKTID